MRERTPKELAKHRWFGPEPSRWEHQPKQRLCRVVHNSAYLSTDRLQVFIDQTLECGAIVICKTAGVLPIKRQCEACTMKGEDDARARYERAHAAWERRVGE